MYIDNVSLLGFRNLLPLDLKLNNGINLFYGNNAQGKTNFLESLYFCAAGRSHRTRIDKELIAFAHQESHIRLQIQKNQRKERIDVHLKREEKKGIAVNGVPIRRLGDLYGVMSVVIFSPEDLNLVKEGPAQRRRFLDMELCQLSKVYYNDLQQYYHILKQRNFLLKKIQKKASAVDTLFVWNQQLAYFGDRLISARMHFLSRLNEISSRKQESLTGGKDRLKIVYKPNCTGEMLEERLKQSVQRDIFYGTTQNGPHKDDILFLVNDMDVKIYGSQGQQRTTALATRLAEIDLIIQETGHKPILLLDDVLSELDCDRQDYLMKSIEGMQAILTCTGIEDSIKKYLSSGFLFYVENGSVQLRAPGK